MRSIWAISLKVLQNPERIRNKKIRKFPKSSASTRKRAKTRISLVYKRWLWELSREMQRKFLLNHSPSKISDNQLSDAGELFVREVRELTFGMIENEMLL